MTSGPSSPASFTGKGGTKFDHVAYDEGQLVADLAELIARRNMTGAGKIAADIVAAYDLTRKREPAST